MGAVARILADSAFRVAGDALSGEEGGGKTIKVIAVLAVAALAISLVPIFTILTGAKSFVSAAETLLRGATRVEIEDTLGSKVSMSDVKAYIRKVEDLEKYARAKWDSGTGEDIYHMPTWRYLYAYDLAVSGTDMDLVEDNADYYDALHRSLLKATPLSRVRVVACEREDRGAYTVIDDERLSPAEYDSLCAKIKAEAEAAARRAEEALRSEIPVPEDLGYALRREGEGNAALYWSGSQQISAMTYYAMLEEDAARKRESEAALAARAAIHVEPVYTLPEANWVRDEEYWIWCVTYTPLKKAFAADADSLLSAKYRKVAGIGGATYETVWQNSGSSCGLYGFAPGEELDAFFGMASEYAGLEGLVSWKGMAIEDGAEAFAADWASAAAAHTQEMVWAQDRAYVALFDTPARALARECGVAVSGAKDEEIALLAVFYRTLGAEALRELLEGVAGRAGMALFEVLSAAIAEEEGPAASALRKLCFSVEALKADDTPERTTPSLRYVGTDPACESGTFTLEVKAVLAPRYAAILKSVEVKKIAGIKHLTFDGDVYRKAVLSPLAASNDMVEVAIEFAEDDTHGYSQSSGMDGGAGRCMDPDVDCSSFVYYTLLEIGYTKDQLGTYPFTTRTMGRLLVAAGFEELDFTSFDDLEYGDIIVRHGEHAHTEIVSGERETVGAHDNYDGMPGDSSGNEVSVLSGVRDSLWEGAKVYRRTE